MMYDVNRIITEAKKYIKFRDDGLTNYGTLVPASLQGSGSFYVNDLAALKLLDVKQALEQDLDGTIQGDLSTILDSSVDHGIVTVIEEFLSKARSMFVTGDIVKDLNVVNKPAPFGSFEQADGRFIGYRVKPLLSKGLKVTIPKLGFQLKNPQTLKVYLYATNKKNPIYTQDVVIDDDLELVWADFNDQMISYTEENEGCEFFLGVYEASPEHVRSTDLQTNPMIGAYTGCCGGDDAVLKTMKYSRITPVVIPADYLNWSDVAQDYQLPGDWNLDYAEFCQQYDSPRYWRTLQFRINVECDLTDILISNIDRFLRAFQYQIGVNLLWICYRSGNFSPEHEKKVNDYRNFALKYENDLSGDNDSNGIITDIVLDLNGVDRSCLTNKLLEPYVGSLNSR